MLGSTGGLVGSSGESGSLIHEGNGGGSGGEVVGSSSLMSGGIGDEEKGGGDFYEGDRSTGGNRWPRQETLALLKIRSDMDAVFRDSSLKGPLWEEVSRKMAELGYHRSSKKCKEKFENVYKYHKRTKDGRGGNADGKTYRFFDQLEALEQHHSSPSSSQLLPLPPVTLRGGQWQPPVQAAVPITMVIPAGAGNNSAGVTVSSSPNSVSVVHTSCVAPQQVQAQHHVNLTHIPQLKPQVMHPNPYQAMPVHHSSPIQMENASSPSATPSTSWTSSDDELLGKRKRKRKWRDFFESLMKEVIDKQEESQKRFLAVIEKRERERLAREETWKLQEMARLNREHEILVQERSMTAAKDAALISFLQKLSDLQEIQIPSPVQAQGQTQAPTPARNTVPVMVTSTVTATTQQPSQQAQPVVLQTPPPQHVTQVQEIPVSLTAPAQAQPQPQAKPPPEAQPITQMPPQAAKQQALVLANTNLEFYKAMNNGRDQLQASSSRWPKAEVQALIQLRTNLDQKYQENGPKGPLWEEISASMKKLGYNRNPKRCKEKWENINKYFKKVKESNKKRPQDSKTCPYFYLLDALYREKGKGDIITSNPAYNPTNTAATYAPKQQSKPENLNTMGPIMAHPEQQWHSQPGSPGSESDDSDDINEDDDEDDHGNGFEIVANNNTNNNGITNSTAATAR